MDGVVARLVRDKGFGFIRGNADGVERFFHRSSVRPNATAYDEMTEGDAVTFDDSDGPKGPRAENVVPA